MSKIHSTPLESLREARASRDAKPAEYPRSTHAAENKNEEKKGIERGKEGQMVGSV